MHLKRFTDLGLRILMHLANEADPETLPRNSQK